MIGISRRTFVKRGSFAAASMTLLTTFSKQLGAQSLAKATGIQLYTVGKELNQDMPGTLAKISAIGYRTVESAGMAGKSAADFRKALDGSGLKCPSSHLFLAPGQSAPEYLEGIKILGSKYAVSSVMFKPKAELKGPEDFVKYISSMNQDDYKRMAEDLNKLGTQAKSVGLQFAYHNHNLEFRQWSDGTTAYDTLMGETDPSLVKIELDCGWADLAGHSPLTLFKKYPGRVRMLHIKDFRPVPHPMVELDPKNNPEWTELGKGHIDYREILAAAPQAGVEQIFVEQEPPFTKFAAFDAAKANYDYLQSIG